MPMSDDYQRIEVITGSARRRRWTTEQKLRIIEEREEPGTSVSDGTDFGRRLLATGTVREYCRYTNGYYGTC